jgi:membrane-bound lytic murein transglycosylase D
LNQFNMLRRQLRVRICLVLASGLFFCSALHAAPPNIAKVTPASSSDLSADAATPKPASTPANISGNGPKSTQTSDIAANTPPKSSAPNAQAIDANQALARTGRLNWLGIDTKQAEDPAPASQSDSQDANADDSQDTTASANAEPDNIWDRIRQGLRMKPMDSPLVEAHERWYVDHPDYVKRMLERSRRYLYHIVEEVQRRGMPMEIALLPMIESGYNPQALSPADAAGIWQFIPTTGRKYGLEQNSWYDGRRDITAATQAALDYLQKLFVDFGSWKLALAAYNCGENCVSRAIQRNAERGLPTNYESLRLPYETRHYVPKLMAVRDLIEEPQSFGIELNDIPNQPYFTQVSFNPNNIDMRSAARLAGMSVDEFLNLNPAFRRRVIRSDSEVSVLVPIDKADQFETNLEKEKGEWDSWQPYRARKGEAVSRLAERFDTTVTRLSEHNHLKLFRGRFRHNQVILVPVSANAETDNNRHLASWKEIERQDFSDSAGSFYFKSRVHKVRRGESLYSIARKYRVSTATLKRWNGLSTSHIKAGQHLVIKLAARSSRSRHATASRRSAMRHSAKAPARHQAKARYYRVRRGDTLSSISNRFNVDIADLKRLNGIRGHHIQAGDRLQVGS